MKKGTIFFLVLISFFLTLANATHLGISEDEFLLKITSVFDCPSEKNKEACNIIKEYKGATLPKEGDFLGRDRLVNVGYLHKNNGSVEKQLIVLGYSWTRDFHKKLYFPNKVCSMFVLAKRDKEEELINSAIDSLLVNRSVVNNGAYQYGKSYEWDSKNCLEIELASNKTSVSTHSGKWRIRFNKNHIYFLSDGWEEGEYLIFKAKQ